MTTRVRNRLLLLGVVWGLMLAAVPALVMTNPYRLTSFLAVSLLCAALSGAVGTLAAGRWAARNIGRSKSGGSSSLVLVGAGAFQGLVGGGFAALMFWILMAVTISGFTLHGPVELSVLTSPRVFTGSFFVALSAFVYAFVGGLLLGPVFGTLINRAVRSGGKEDLVVR